MSAFFTSWPFVWAQANAATAANAAANPVPNLSPRAIVALMWVYLASNPSISVRDSLLGGILTWIKAISLICLVCWVVSWLIIGVKERIIAQGRWYDYLGVLGAILTPVAVMLKVLEDAKRIAPYRISALLAHEPGGHSVHRLLRDLGRDRDGADDSPRRPSCGRTRSCRAPPRARPWRGRRHVLLLERHAGLADAGRRHACTNRPGSTG